MTECLFQGSFNPIHNAHLSLAEYVHKKFGFDKIIFIPAFKPPHKDIKNFDTENSIHRLEMVQLAVKNIPFLDVSAIEYTRNKPSYTYDTIVQILQITNSQEKIKFIIGSDAFMQIESWYKSEDLKHLVDFILFVREKNLDKNKIEQLKQKGYNYILMDMPYVDISSSEIRRRCRNKESIEDIVPLEVAKYIQENDLYRT